MQPVDTTPLNPRSPPPGKCNSLKVAKLEFNDGQQPKTREVDLFDHTDQREV